MTWIVIGIMIILGFGEYWCSHYLIKRVFRLSENRSHLLLASVILICIALPRSLLVTVFFVTTLFTPFIIWCGLKLVRHR